MAKNHYTFLIVPRKKSSVRKISVSSALVKCAAGAGILFVLCLVFFLYDYATTKSKDFELSYLKKLTNYQKTRIDSLATKVTTFEKKMENLKQFDEKIRSMTNFGKQRSENKSQMLGIGGVETEKGVVVGVNDLEQNLDRLIRDASAQEHSFTQLLDLLRKRESILAATPSIWPVQGWVTSEFGSRSSPFGDDEEFHKGVDIACRMGNVVHAPADGIVSEVVNRSDMGNYVVIDHIKGIATGYAHLLRSAVVAGQRVKRGDVIGYVGNSGRSTGPHLHYSVSLNGILVNPRKYLN